MTPTLEQTASPPQISLKEYFDYELTAQTRNAYINGVIKPMTGGTPAHNQIAGNLFALLHFALQDSNYASFITDQRLWLSIPNIATYPDVMVIAEPITLMEGRKDTLMNPLFIAEVLSNTTESYDRTDKFAAYRTISTFKEYLLIAQDRVYVEHFHKQGEDWIFAAYQEATTIQLRHLMIEIRTEDLYRRVFK